MNQIQNEYILMWIDGDILYGYYPREIIIGLDVCFRIFRDREDLCKGQKFATVWDCRNIKYWTKEAMDFMSSPEYNRLIHVAAIIYSESIVTTIIRNFYVSFFKPPVPVKFFTNETEAVKWVKKVS